MEDEGTNQRLEITLSGDTQKLTIGYLMEFFMTIDKRYRELGGRGLRIEDFVSGFEVEVAESPNEQQLGTQFANTKKAIREEPYTDYEKRKRAHKVIDKYFKREEREAIKDDLEKRFPKKEFGDEIPIIPTVIYLSNITPKKRK